MYAPLNNFRRRCAIVARCDGGGATVGGAPAPSWVPPIDLAPIRPDGGCCPPRPGALRLCLAQSQNDDETQGAAVAWIVRWLLGQASGGRLPLSEILSCSNTKCAFPGSAPRRAAQLGRRSSRDATALPVLAPRGGSCIAWRQLRRAPTARLTAIAPPPPRPVLTPATPSPATPRPALSRFSVRCLSCWRACGRTWRPSRDRAQSQWSRACGCGSARRRWSA
jgi:hypothetical protein